MNNNNQIPPQNQPPSPQQYYYPDDEISLIDLWNTLMRRKKIVIAVFALVIVVAVIYLLLTKPVYESRAMIQVGQVGSVGDVEEFSEMKQRLLAESPVLDSVEKKSNNTATLVVTNTDRETSQEQLDKIVNNLLDKHRNRFHDLSSPVKERRDTLQRRLSGFEHQLDELDLQINRLRADQPVQAAVLMIEKGNIIRATPELEERLAELEQALSEPRTQQTEMVGEIVSPENPIKPKPGLVMALSIILGLMLGIFAAFFAEFIAKARTSTTGTVM
ncbi:Wzz/FepE/Etk N-terminal domain-containing protein [Thiohalophilus thiocyanatoxydans]|uniref:Putative tyrosine kinase-like protein n=1 Tax=Thiohalophilus thiocyanatoxydans TaxID=381308 RepID=A0A4R8IQ33_9GAMM|nr:Wzz/FepE/Etk N-terminal domain-containing protein [Thiohalophilus thiocyanatoxydans]TDY02668.1 putative tyrosine kinase-like protein [Thiohalophilus thiocyanatoxydans]